MTVEPTRDPERPDDGVCFDPVAGRLSMVQGSLSLAARGGNRAVLEAFALLVESSRHGEPDGPVVVEEADLDGLVEALDLEDPELLEVARSVLGATTDEAIALLARLHAHRVRRGRAG